MPGVFEKLQKAEFQANLQVQREAQRQWERMAPLMLEAQRQQLERLSAWERNVALHRIATAQEAQARAAQAQARAAQAQASQSQNYRHGYRAPRYPGYYNGRGIVLGHESLPNGENRLTLPGGQTFMWYHDGYVPVPWDDKYYPNANYGAVRRP